MELCPHCNQKSPSGKRICTHCGKNIYRQPETEWSSIINQIVRDYRTGHAKGLAHGLQKDAIQNGWGALYNKTEWGFEFAVIEGEDDQTFLTMTDCGTTGLTGQIYSDPENIPDNLPFEERLARFENMSFSGGNAGPGLYGRGKLIFQAVSDKKEIIYESLTINGEYRLGRRFLKGRRLEQTDRVFENDTAIGVLRDLTKGAVKPLTSAGTRIILIEPSAEILDSIRDGSFNRYIEETWWEILLKYNANIKIVYNGTTLEARCPEEIQMLANRKSPAKISYYRENEKVHVKGDDYRIKRIAMAVSDEPIYKELRGLCINRKGMKVGTIEIRDMPSDIEDRFYGFIELDDRYEDLISEAEDTVHYSFGANYKSYRELKKLAQFHFDRFKDQLGYGAPPTESRERDKAILEDAQNKLNEIMGHLGWEGLGFKRTIKRDILISIANVDFPDNRSKRVELGNTISNLEYLIKNKSNNTKDIKIILDARKSNSDVIETIVWKKVRLVGGGDILFGPHDVEINSDLYPNYEQIFITCRAESALDELLAKRLLPVYIGVDEPEITNAVEIDVAEIHFPREKNTRVNYGEEIKNIHYVVRNNLAGQLATHITVTTLSKDDKREIEIIFHKEVALKPASDYDIEIPAIYIDEEVYHIVGEGEVLIRCRVTLTHKQFGYKKGYKWKRNVKFWLNRDEPGFGIFEEIEFFKGGDEQPRSKVEPMESGASRWRFLLNVTHSHHETIRDSDPLYQRYSFELMARDALYIALYTEKYDPFDGQLSAEEQPDTVSKEYNSALDRLLAAYYNR